MIVAGHLYKCTDELTINPDCIPGREKTVWRENKVYKCFKDGFLPNELKDDQWERIGVRIVDCFEDVGTFDIDSPNKGEVWTHTETNKDYRVISSNAKMKDIISGEWIDCVIYLPLYENDTEMFSRGKTSFCNEFVRKDLSK